MQSTVVTLLPYPIPREVKPGLFPAEYSIPAAPDGGIAVLVVNDGSRGVYLDDARGTEHVLVAGDVIANSLVEDYAISQPASDQTARPGLFFVKGKFTAEEIRKQFTTLVESTRAIQREWWRRLIRLADDTWQRNHQIAQIGDLERTACRQLGLKRDWLDDNPDTIIKCPVCTTLVSTYALVCFACHVILKPEEYKKYQFAGAPVSVQTLNTKE